MIRCCCCSSMEQAASNDSHREIAPAIAGAGAAKGPGQKHYDDRCSLFVTPEKGLLKIRGPAMSTPSLPHDKVRRIRTACALEW